ncbi:MAG: pirin family protein [Bacteroidota bacterium]
MSNFIIHKAEQRGHAQHGWLDTFHSFSFANYHDPEKVHFGVLRVLNDDTIEGGMGFGMHPHDNMEIITIPIFGGVHHKDSMGNSGIINTGDVQVMSAGTGIYHSEENANAELDLKLFQIWIFPNKKNVTPRYDQKTFEVKDRINKFQQIVSPMGETDGLNIHQDAWFSLANFNKDFETTYQIKKPGNGVYVFVIEGSATINNQKLNKRDAIGISAIQSISIKADTDAQILIMDIPMAI